MPKVNIRFTRKGTSTITGEASVFVEQGQNWREVAERHDWERFLPLSVEFDEDSDEWEFELDDNDEDN